MDTQTIFILLSAFQAKHFLADYPFQRKFMLGKFRDDWGFVVPLLAHVAVHAFGTFLITCWFGIVQALLLSLFDAVMHFLMDRVKASRKLLGRFKPLTAEKALTATPEQWRSNDRFWWAVGFDQLFHHMTHYMIIFYLATV